MEFLRNAGEVESKLTSSCADEAASTKLRKSQQHGDEGA
jgi:hypothetical protein